jgi:YggT family protein
MLAQAIVFLLGVVLGTLVFAALVRFFMQACRAPMRNPLGEFATALTDFAVLPMRRVIPGLYGLDLASFFFAWACQSALRLATYLLEGRSVLGSGGHALPVALFLGFVDLIRYSLYLFIGAVIIQAVMSWVNSYGSPIGPVLDSLTRPVLRPLRKRIPPVGNVDLTPLVAIVIAQLLLMLPVQWLEFMAQKLL